MELEEEYGDVQARDSRGKDYAELRAIRVGVIMVVSGNHDRDFFAQIEE